MKENWGDYFPSNDYHDIEYGVVRKDINEYIMPRCNEDLYVD